MSLRYEQYRSLLSTKQLLDEILLNPHSKWSATELKARACSCLKHYPFLTEKGEPIWSRDRLTDDDTVRWQDLVAQLKMEMNDADFGGAWTNRLDEMLEETGLKLD